MRKGWAHPVLLIRGGEVCGDKRREHTEAKCRPQTCLIYFKALRQGVVGKNNRERGWGEVRGRLLLAPCDLSDLEKIVVGQVFKF